ncbi:hypothetical protein IDF54_14555 [Flavobacterium sp. SaA2.13]|nr:hypothetical protein [Flavobacterium sp. SaA2.13]
MTTSNLWSAAGASPCGDGVLLPDEGFVRLHRTGSGHPYRPWFPPWKELAGNVENWRPEGMLPLRSL